MVELLKLLMREVKNMPKADNRTLGIAGKDGKKNID